MNICLAIITHTWAGAETVVYEFRVYMGAKNSTSYIENAFKVFHNGAELPQAYSVYCKHENGHDYGWITFKVSVPSWSGSRNFYVLARPTTSTTNCGKFHQVYSVYANGSNTRESSSRFVKPLVGITAFG